MTALTSERIQSLFKAFREHDPHRKWREDYRGVLERVQGYDAKTLRSPKAQEDLWSARDLASVGPGSAIDVSKAFTDPKIIEAITALRDRRWPADPQERAEAVEKAYGELVGLLYPRLTRKRPWARLARLFAALLPREMHSCFNSASRASIGRLLLDAHSDSLGSAVLARARLREALGPERDLDDDAWRAVFCWWLHEKADVLNRGEEPVFGGDSTPPSDEDAPPVEKLTIAPPHKLRRGLFALKGLARMVRLVVEATQRGASNDDIIETLRDAPDHENLPAATARRCINRVRMLGMIEHRDGLLHPSELGQRLLNDPRQDPLVEQILTTTFGLAHYLRLLADGPIPRREANRRLQATHATWTTTRMPQYVASWARSLGLARTRDGNVELTEYGEEWERRLPEQLPVPPPRERDDDEADDDDDETEDNAETDDLASQATSTSPRRSSTRATLEAPPLSAVQAKIAAAVPDFVIPADILRALHLAWHSNPEKRFVIFSGLSGTGKTALLNHYAEAYCELLGLEVRTHRVVAPVAPDWRDPSGLLGYFNALHADPTYLREPALQLVLAAARRPDRPFFLILDEMNLARVEHYFAPFLSAMETGDQLTLHAHEEAINGVPPSIEWPRNLFIGGTVNMDETTHAISDKVLDRAFTVEFWEVDLKAFFKRRAEQPGARKHDKAEKVLAELSDHLKAVRRHFGYRSAREVLAFLDAGANAGLDEAALGDALDQAVFSKILPRIRGEESEQLYNALEKSRAVCAAAGLARSEQKLEHMRETLRTTGLTRFWA